MAASCIPGTSTSVLDGSDGKYVLCVAVFTISPHFGWCLIRGSQSPWYTLKPQIAKGRRALRFHCQLCLNLSLYEVAVHCCLRINGCQLHKINVFRAHSVILLSLMHLLIILLYFATHLSTKSCGRERVNQTQSRWQALKPQILKGRWALCFTASHAFIF